MSYQDKYKEFEQIGRGSYGAAFLVRNLQDQKMYVAKKLNLASMKQKEQEDSKQEVALLQKLNHPHIVQYKDSFQEQGTLIIIMEYCEEGDLQFHINRKQQKNETFPEKVILNWFLQSALALKYIHEQKILHRDIKSQNIFLNSSGFIKIGDFGISRVLEYTYEQAETVVGTPYYMSPEVCENKPYTYKSDVWALGCVLYELCNLTHAFKSNNLLGLVNRIVKDQVTDIKNHYSRELNELVQKLLSKRADQRPSTQEILQYPLIRSTMDDFIKQQGLVLNEKVPIKRTNTHNNIDKMIKNEQMQNMTPAQRLKYNKEQEALKREQELRQATKHQKQESQLASERRQQELQGSYARNQQNDKSQKKQYHDILQQQQQENTARKEQQSNRTGNFDTGGDTLVSIYENTSKQLQNNSSQFQRDLQEFDKTVVSGVMDETKKSSSRVLSNKSSLEGTDRTVISNFQETQQTQVISNSVLNRFQEQELSVTQQYQNEPFEEYNSDEEMEIDEEEQLRLTVKPDNKNEVLKLYQQEMDKTIKKRSLEDIREVSQESWASNSAQSPIQPKQGMNSADKINNLKNKVIALVGSDNFNKVYAFLNHHIQKETPSKQVHEQLEKMVGGKQNAKNYTLIDEIIYLEQMSK
ncbi:hypothetical protein pb186bvf_001790 [Paramecium bursaria]